MARLVNPPPAKKDKDTLPRILRTSAGLRNAIFDEIDAIRNGTSSPTRANAVAKLASGIVETVRMEIEVQRYIGQTAAAQAMGNVKDILLASNIDLSSGDA